MSIRVMTEVWSSAHATLTSRRSHAALLVMLALADWSNDAGESWPSNEEICKKARIGERTLVKIKQNLIKDGLLSVKLHEGTGRGDRRTNRYNITLPTTLQSLQPRDGHDPAHSAVTTLQTMSDDPANCCRGNHHHRTVREEDNSLQHQNASGKEETLDSVLEDLKQYYTWVNIEREKAKMLAWKTQPRNKFRQLTRKFIINWLNKIDRPIQSDIPKSYLRL